MAPETEADAKAYSAMHSLALDGTVRSMASSATPGTAPLQTSDILNAHYFDEHIPAEAALPPSATPHVITESLASSPVEYKTVAEKHAMLVEILGTDFVAQLTQRLSLLLETLGME